MSKESFLESCTKLSKLYNQLFLVPRMENFPNYSRDIWDSLKFFLDGYAFEHQGRSHSYAPVAVDTIKFENSVIMQVKASCVWNAFVEKLNGEDPNDRNNPLCPKGTAYKDKKGTHKTQKPSLVELMQRQDFYNMTSLVSYVGDILRRGEIEKAYQVLREINGVGHKIASLFLRDVAVILNINVSVHGDNRYLLQPIDIWIRFCINLCQPSLGQSTKLDEQCARFIVENTDEPEKTNQGIWYFCAQVAGSSKYKVRRSFKEDHYMNDLIEEHIGYLRLCGKVASDYI